MQTEALKVSFAKAFRLCGRVGALNKGADAVRQAVDGVLPCPKVEPVTLGHFEGIDGFRVETEFGNAFFPIKKVADLCVEDSYGWLRRQFLKAELVLPPMVNVIKLGKIATEIEQANPGDEGAVFKKHCDDLYPVKAMAAIHANSYLDNAIMKKYGGQIGQCLEAYYFGLKSVAITALIPCIEGIIRDVGGRIGLTCHDHISANELLNILEKVMRKYIHRIFDGYIWYPSGYASIDLHDCLDERIKIVEGLRYYIKVSLYEHTSRYQGQAQLNRNGIVHGFVNDFDSDDNFFRLIAVLNALYVATMLAGADGLPIIPGDTLDSLRFEQHLRVLASVGPRMRAMGTIQPPP